MSAIPPWSRWRAWWWPRAPMGLTVHPRPDERHIRRSDVPALAELIAAELPAAIEFNVEGYPTPDFIALVQEDTAGSGHLGA